MIQARRNPDDIFTFAVNLYTSGKRDVLSPVNKEVYEGYSSTFFSEYLTSAGIEASYLGLKSITKSYFTKNNAITRFLSKHPDFISTNSRAVTTRANLYFGYNSLVIMDEVSEFKDFIKDIING